MQFVDIKNDVAFRKIFGNENRKEVLISFLNAVLLMGNDKKIINVDILTPYQLPAIKGGKVTIVDLKAKDQNGKQYIVEMQVADVEDFDKRVLYYASKSYSAQIQRGDEYEKLNPVFFIGILNFNITLNPDYLSRHKLVDIQTGENLISDIEFNFIELLKFNKKEDELSSIIDQWVYFIKNAESLQVIPVNIKDEGLKTAYEDAATHNWSVHELEAYDYVFMREQDFRGRLSYGIKKGVKEGIKKGVEKIVAQAVDEAVLKLNIEVNKAVEDAIEKTALEQKQAIANQLLQLGLSINDIAKTTGLTNHQVQQIK